MNPYKLRAILEYVEQEKKAGDGISGEACEVDELLACLGLDKLLSIGEMRMVRNELVAVAEAEAFMERLRFSVVR